MLVICNQWFASCNQKERRYQFEEFYLWKVDPFWALGNLYAVWLPGSLVWENNTTLIQRHPGAPAWKPNKKSVCLLWSSKFILWVCVKLGGNTNILLCFISGFGFHRECKHRSQCSNSNVHGYWYGFIERSFSFSVYFFMTLSNKYEIMGFKLFFYPCKFKVHVFCELRESYLFFFLSS